MTQEDLAERVGIRQNSISGFETGSDMPSVETLEAIADATGESVDWLLGRERMARELETFEEILMEALSRRALRLLKGADQAQLAELAKDFSALAESRLASKGARHLQTDE